MMKRSLSLFVVMCILIGLMCIPALAEEHNGAMIGTQNLKNGQYVLFGGNTWLVLDANADNAGNDGIFLLSADVVESGIAFNAGGLSNVWADSDAKAWAADYAASFDAAELEAIKAVSKSDAADENWIASGLENEQVFFLSAQEVSAYCVEGLAAGNGWWLRSGFYNGKNSLYAGAVSDVGIVSNPHVAAQYDARPALNLDATKVTMLKYVSADTYKVALLDESRSFTASADVQSQQIGYSNWTVNVTYAGAKTGSNEFVTAMICDANGNAVYTADVASNSESGEATVAIPAGLAGKYTMYVFSDQRNADSETDYTSAPVAIALNVEDGMGEVKGWSLTLADDLILKCHMDVENADAAQITVAGKTVKQTVAQAQKDENGYCIFTAEVAAAQMTEQVTVQLVSGEELGVAYTYTVRQYADALLADETKADCHNLVKEMLNYGAKAQSYFGVNETDMADSGIAVEPVQIPTDVAPHSVTGNADGISYYGATLVFAGKTAIRYYFTVDGSIENYSFTVNGASCEPVEKDGLYYVEVSGINPQDLDKTVTVCVNNTMEVAYSPMNYMARMSVKGTDTLQALLAAMYGYHLAAQAYVG